MDLFQSLAAITKHTLSIIDTKVSRKYVEEIIELEELKRAEQSKPKDKQDHAVLDNIDFKLCLISTYATTLKAEKA